jgi:hypothetical protein
MGAARAAAAQRAWAARALPTWAQVAGCIGHRVVLIAGCVDVWRNAAAQLQHPHPAWEALRAALDTVRGLGRDGICRTPEKTRSAMEHVSVSA